jgi:hypothetical protein
MKTAGWFPAEIGSDGFPILIRRGIQERDEVSFRLWLEQPLILYGHIDDLASGLEPLAAVAREVASFGDVRWSALGEIAETNYKEIRTPVSYE